MFLFELTRWLRPISAWKLRSAVRRPDNGIIALQPRGHRPVYIRRCPADIDTLYEIFRSRVYDEALSHLSSCSTFIDLGANIGLASVLVNERFPNCRIYAFEPHPDNYEMLRRNAPFASCTQAAAWSVDTSISLAASDDVAFNAFEAKAGGNIPAYAMSKIIADVGSVDFLKIDIEGSEVEILKDPAWLESVGLLAIEFHGDTRKESQFDQKLQQYGFTVLSSARHTTVAKRNVLKTSAV